jgi:hypothetical protein
MKSFAILVLLGISSAAMAWSFGGLDVKEMKEIQEDSYQTGRACLRGDTLDACSVFVKNISKHSKLLSKHEAEIFEKIKKDDPDCQQIMLNAERLQELSNKVLKKNER